MHFDIRELILLFLLILYTVISFRENSIIYVLICKMFFPLSFYWDCFSLSGLNRYFQCKTINICFYDITVAVMMSHCVKIYYPIYTLVLPQVSCKNYTLLKWFITGYSTPTFKGYPWNIEFCAKYPSLHFCSSHFLPKQENLTRYTIEFLITFCTKKTILQISLNFGEVGQNFYWTIKTYATMYSYFSTSIFFH